jgi:hypothetical protein
MSTPKNKIRALDRKQEASIEQRTHCGLRLPETSKEKIDSYLSMDERTLEETRGIKSNVEAIKEIFAFSFSEKRSKRTIASGALEGLRTRASIFLHSILPIGSVFAGGIVIPTVVLFGVRHGFLQSTNHAGSRRKCLQITLLG